MEELLEYLEDSIAHDYLHTALLHSEMDEWEEDEIIEEFGKYCVDRGLNAYEVTHVLGIAFLRFVNMLHSQDVTEIH